MSIANILKNMARKIHNNDKKVGDLTQLSTAEKTNIVAAINALSADLGGRENISAERVQQIAAQELAKITNGASAAMDTLAEIEAAFGSNNSQIASLLTEIGLAKTKLEVVESNLTAVETFVGFDESETLDDVINRLMNTGGA